MAAKSDYLENRIIDHIFRDATFTKPTTLAVALFTDAVSDDGTGTEVTGGDYARVELGPANVNWDVTDGTDGLTANSVEILFNTPTDNWGTITHMAIFDAATGGNMLYHGALQNPKTVNLGDPGPSFPIGALTVTES